MRSTALFVSALSFALNTTGCGVDASGSDPVSDEADISASRIQTLGAIAVGETKTVYYTATPSYRAYSFQATAGQHVEFWVRSTSGDAVAYILRPSGTTMALDDDANAATKDAHVSARIAKTGLYSIAIKDAKGRPATFTVSFVNPAPIPGPATDDPFDPASCTGAPLTRADALAKFGTYDNASLGNYQLKQRSRICQDAAHCGAYSAASVATYPRLLGSARLRQVGSTISLELTDTTMDTYLPSAVFTATSGTSASSLSWQPFTYTYLTSVSGLGATEAVRLHADTSTPALFAATVTSHCARFVSAPAFNETATLYRAVYEYGTVIRY